jgi:hypothetical protein
MTAVMKYPQVRRQGENGAFNVPIPLLGFQAVEVVLKLEFSPSAR